MPFLYTLMAVFLTLAIAAVLLWGGSQVITDATILKWFRTVVIVVVAIWLLYVLFGLLSGLLASGAGFFPYPYPPRTR